MGNWVERIKNLLMIKPPIRYQMGADRTTGNDPALDCSAFIWRVLGERKYDPDIDVWRNTSWVYDDIDKYNTKFDKVKLEDAIGGDVIVYGWEKGKAGHIAIITGVDKKGTIMGWDCSSSANGISYRNLTFFKRKKYLLGRYK